jgi:hypothetical protein
MISTLFLDEYWITKCLLDPDPNPNVKNFNVKMALEKKKAGLTGLPGKLSVRHYKQCRPAFTCYVSIRLNILQYTVL